jgi:methyl-accepting chemotaxis protein
MEKEKTGKRESKRRQLFIDRGFQSKFIMKFCGIVAAGSALTIGLIYFLSLRYTSITVENSRVVVKSTADLLLQMLLQTVLIVMIVVRLFTIFTTLVFSHKLAGPLYRFRKIMQSLEEGDFSADFKLRKLDQLQELANVFNRMILKIRTELNVLKEDFNALKSKLDSISGNEVVEHKRLCFSELKQITDHLNKILDHFKT